MSSQQEGPLFAVAAWSRALTDDEVSLLSTSPWAVYTKRQPWWKRLLRWVGGLL